MPQQMLNIGLHFDEVPKEKGGLRLIPGSHKQGFLSMCFRKPYFVSHGPDPQEIAVETLPGDLTVHDGRLWHRVQQSPLTGPASLRRSMYVPYLTDAYQPKSESSKTPAYHYLSMAMLKLKSLVR
jgi:ectoine hydroxylase-related dioxygenase (phytanoyl-CoA dioxygenase family)